MRFGKGRVVYDRAGVAERHMIVFPIGSSVVDRGHHFFRSHLLSGLHFDGMSVMLGAEFQVSSADINGQYVHASSSECQGRPERDNHSSAALGPDDPAA